MSDVFAVRGRPTGRGRPTDPLLHAVPGTDRTRSALCGARVGGAPLPWTGPAGTHPTGHDPVDPVQAGGVADLLPAPAACPECAALLDAGTASVAA